MFKELTDQQLYLLFNAITNNINNKRVKDEDNAAAVDLRYQLFSEVERRYQENKANGE